MLGVEESADCPERAHAHNSGSTGGAAQQLHTHHHIFCAVQAEGKLGNICPQRAGVLLFFQQGFQAGCLFKVVGRGNGDHPGGAGFCQKLGSFFQARDFPIQRCGQGEQRTGNGNAFSGIHEAQATLAFMAHGHKHRTATAHLRQG